MKFNLSFPLNRDNIFILSFYASILIYGLSGVFGFAFLSLATIWGLVAFRFLSWTFSKEKIALYIALSLTYFVFFIRSLYGQSLGDLFWEMGPVLPLLILPLLVFLSPFQRLSLSPKSVGRITTLSSLTALVYFLFAKYQPDILSFLGLKNTLHARFEAIHGNAVTFGVVILSLGCFSLIGWKNERTPFRFIALISFCWSVYAVVFQSQVRSLTIVVIVFAIAIAIAIAIKKSNRDKIFLLTLGGISALFLSLQSHWFENIHIPERSTQAFDIIFSDKLNSSDRARVAMWEAGYEAFKDDPILGQGYKNRFSPLRDEGAPSYLKIFKHLHNDVLTGLVISGVLGGIVVMLLLSSPLIAWALFNRSSKEIFYLTSALTIIFYAAALSNTILFNDVTPAWIVLSSLLAAKIDPKIF